jgi:hypothetical protein
MTPTRIRIDSFLPAFSRLPEDEICNDDLIDHQPILVQLTEAMAMSCYQDGCQEEGPMIR